MTGKIYIGLLGLLIAAAGILYITHKDGVKAAEGGALAPQAMQVSVQVVRPEPVQIWNDFSARLEAFDFAEIRPQVSGTITEVKFQDGQQVETGDVLFVIDPRPYEAAVKQAEAAVNAARNESTLAQKELSRAKELVDKGAVSVRILDERQARARVASANIASARAQLDRAKIDLDYAYVKAPISGRTSRVEVKVGNLVEAGSGAPVLTSIVSTDMIYADFDVDEQTYVRSIRSSVRDPESEKSIPVKLFVEGDGTEYTGHIDSFDNRIDPSTGTIRARALFENKDGALLSGMFAKVKMGSPVNEEKILVTERAIGTDQDRKYVYVVNGENMTEYREVKIGVSTKGKRVILSGLSAGEKIITDGIIRIRPGMPVDPQISDPQPTQTQ